MDPIAEGVFNAEAYYTFSVEDVTGTKLGIEWMSQGEFDYVWKLESGQLRTLVDRAGQPAQPKKVVIHYDGRDSVRIFGTFWDADWLAPDDVVANFNWSYQWPDRKMRDGAEGVLTRGDGWGNKVKVRWRITKGQDLTD
jgi:hypothetical protein